MQDIVYKLVPGLQEGKCRVLFFSMMKPTRDPANNLKSFCCDVSTTVRYHRLHVFTNWLGISEKQMHFNKIFLLSLLGLDYLMKQVSVHTHDHTHTPLNFKGPVTAVTLSKRHCPLLFFSLAAHSYTAEIKKQREFYQKLGMEVPGDIKGELCNMKTHLDQRNGTFHHSLPLPAVFYYPQRVCLWFIPHKIIMNEFSRLAKEEPASDCKAAPCVNPITPGGFSSLIYQVSPHSTWP